MTRILILLAFATFARAENDYNFAGFWKALDSGDYFNYAFIYGAPGGNLELFMTKDGHAFVKVRNSEYNGEWKEHPLSAEYLSAAGVNTGILKIYKLDGMRKAVPPSQLSRYAEQKIEPPLLLIITATSGDSLFSAYIGEYKDDPSKLNLRFENFSR